jgi:hypothetical protein
MLSHSSLSQAQKYYIYYSAYNSFNIPKFSEIKFPEVPIETPNILLSVLPIPFNEHYGNKICPELTQMLLYLFYDIIIININEFINIYKRLPNVSSSFMVTRCKNKNEVIEYNGKKINVYIHNGTLITIRDNEKNIDDLKDILNINYSMTFLQYYKEYIKKMNS